MISSTPVTGPGLDAKRQVTECVFALIEAGQSVNLTVDLTKAYTREIRRKYGRQTAVWAKHEDGYAWAVSFFMENGRGLSEAACQDLFALLRRDIGERMAPITP